MQRVNILAMKIDKSSVIGTYLLILGTLLLCTMTTAQAFTVRVFGALDGKPYGDIPIIYVCDDPAQFQATRKRTVTNANGIAEIPYECKDDKKIKVSTFIAKGESVWAGKVEECGDLEDQAVEQILKVGVISKPTAAGGIWCPDKVSKKMKPIPGQLIIFVKKPTWWQKYLAP